MASRGQLSSGTMRILYQGDMYSGQKYGGITRYFDNVISHLPDSVTPVLTSAKSRLEHARISNPQLKLFRLRRFRPWRLYSLVESAHVRAVTRLVRADVFHPTYYSYLASAGRWPRCPVVLTVYDMIHELLPHEAGGYADSRRKIAEKASVIPRADALICISEHTRKDLMAFFPTVPSSRICVIPLATDLHVTEAMGPTLTQHKPYFMFVGGRSPYKNFVRLLKAFSLLVVRHKDLELRVVGSSFTQEELATISIMGIPDNVHNVGHLPDNALARCYYNSLAFVCPSLYEGFGIPLLEAMACRTAIAASDVSSIPEVAGDAALYFDPYAVEDIAAKLLQLVEDSTLRARLVAAGSVRVQAFSWSKTAEQTYQVYRQMTR